MSVKYGTLKNIFIVYFSDSDNCDNNEMPIAIKRKVEGGLSDGR